MKKIFWFLGAVLLVGGLYYGYDRYREAEEKTHAKFASGNGRIEATEVSISSKLAGRIDDIMVNEGDFVSLGQPLAIMQTNVLKAQLAQAEASRSKAKAAEQSAKTMIDVRASERDAAKATVTQKESHLDGARKRYERSKTLEQAKAASRQTYEDAETEFLIAKAELEEARVKIKQTEVMIEMAKADAVGAAADVLAAEADISRIKADIDDSLLIAPRDGRIQYRISQPGEVLSAGGRVLNLVDLTDVYMTFFLPEETAGRVLNGAEVRLVLDALPNIPIPAKVTYVASVAQFTPKTVETRSEREKLMFRIKARIDPALLKKYIKLVKTGVPGVAWVRMDSKTEWPAFLKLDPRIEK